jgi:hypothetical protein
MGGGASKVGVDVNVIFTPPGIYIYGESTGRCENDFNAHAYSKANAGATVETVAFAARAGRKYHTVGANRLLTTASGVAASRGHFGSVLLARWRSLNPARCYAGGRRSPENRARNFGGATASGGRGAGACSPPPRLWTGGPALPLLSGWGCVEDAVRWYH